MARRGRKYFVVWLFAIGLVGLASMRSYLKDAGYEDLNAFASDALLFVGVLGAFLVPVSIGYAIHKRHVKPKGVSPFQGAGRTARCFKCKRKLEETTGSRCQFCGWIRCGCGACGCGIGKMA